MNHSFPLIYEISKFGIHWSSILLSSRVHESAFSQALSKSLKISTLQHYRLSSHTDIVHSLTYLCDVYQFLVLTCPISLTRLRFSLPKPTAQQVICHSANQCCFLCHDESWKSRIHSWDILDFPESTPSTKTLKGLGKMHDQPKVSHQMVAIWRVTERRQIQPPPSLSPPLGVLKFIPESQPFWLCQICQT